MVKHRYLNLPLNNCCPVMLTTVKKNIIITKVSFNMIKDENITSNIIFKDFIF